MMWNHQEKKKLVLLDAESVRANPAQPRREFEPARLEELAESIRQNGLLQPITVRRTQDGAYELIAGERRLRACRLAGLRQIPCILMGVDARQSAILAMLENLQRHDLGVFEEAEGLRRLVEEWGVTQEEAAARLGKSQSSVANKLRLLRLSEDERKAITQNGLTERHARALLRLGGEEERREALRVIIERGLNVAQAERYIAQLLETREAAKPKRTVLVRDVRIFLNTIRHAVDLMKQNGITAQTLQRESEEYVEYTIRIPKEEAKRECGPASVRSAL